MSRISEVLEEIDTGGRLRGIELDRAPQANILFCRMLPKIIDGLLAQGFRFYYDRWEPGVVRLVTSFATEQADVDDLLAAVRAVAGQPDVLPREPGTTAPPNSEDVMTSTNPTV
jgi:hypothetical protein